MVWIIITIVHPRSLQKVLHLEPSIGDAWGFDKYLLKGEQIRSKDTQMELAKLARKLDDEILNAKNIAFKCYKVII